MRVKLPARKTTRTYASTGRNVRPTKLCTFINTDTTIRAEPANQALKTYMPEQMHADGLCSARTVQKLSARILLLVACGGDERLLNVPLTADLDAVLLVNGHHGIKAGHRQDMQGHGPACTSEGAKDPDPDVAVVEVDDGGAEAASGVERASRDRHESSDEEAEREADGERSSVANLTLGVADGLQDDVDGAACGHHLTEESAKRVRMRGQRARREVVALEQVVRHENPEQCGSDDCAEHLRDHVGDALNNGSDSSPNHRQGDSRVDVAAGKVSDRVDDKSNGNAVAEPNQNEPSGHACGAVSGGSEACLVHECHCQRQAHQQEDCGSEQLRDGALEAEVDGADFAEAPANLVHAGYG
eukprot:TRINITY_DN5882_c0_g1_i1.p1 TRINITY_DN5882_c0_g1~~TRINITY_DN5882_c0_g1_i1.p1  ORF type:complete len:358 (-),score=53.92 TRINITY_DN5882_c0_g1_i1:97-1170(-)